MSGPSPFETSRAIGNNISGALKAGRDENAIERILSEATQSGNPDQLQGAIGKILSQVSPEKQPMAIKYLENQYERVQQKQKQARQQTAAAKYGIDADLPPALQSDVYKQNAKNQYLNKILGNNSQNSSPPAGQLPTQNAPQINEQTQLNKSPSLFNLENKSDEELSLLSGSPYKEVAETAKRILDRRDTEKKEVRADQRELRKETLPLRQEIINQANLSRESIRNKNHLMDIIDRGNLDDPTFAIVAENLPFNLGKRLLSDDTVEYKGGLVDEFGDLKNIFKGATRVKEVEIYENKLADVYLTDSQKKAILKSRINAAQIDLLREEAASEVEEKFPNLSALQFNKKVDEIAKPKVDKLFNSIWDEQKSILDQAEFRKEIPLDPKNPDDYEIMLQIRKEAGGDKERARKLAKKKGYTVVGQK